MTSTSAYLCLFLVASAFSGAYGSKILLIPCPFYTHCTEVSSVGQELLAKGHQVSIFFPDFLKEFSSCYNQTIGTRHIRCIEYRTISQGMGGHEDARNTLSYWLQRDGPPSIFDITEWRTVYARVTCEDIYADEHALEKLREEKFDFVIFSGQVYVYCFVAIPHNLRIPYATLSTYYEDLILGRPFLPTISPSTLTVHTGSMDIYERMKNIAVQLYARFIYRWTFPRFTLSKFAPGLSAADIEHLVSQSELFLHNADPILGYPLPAMPNMISVGGLTARPANKLPEALQRFYDAASNGVIIVSFGSDFGKLPSKKTKKLFGAFYRLETKVLWKYYENEEIGNVKQVTWFPQNDLLGHPKTRLFVSHCGNNGVFEALYHGIPIVCTPLAGDQFFNAVRVESWQVGRQLSAIAASEDEMVQIITETLQNSTIKANMVRASRIYRSRPMNPRQRAAQWVEHVIQYGGKHLRSQASNMSVLAVLGYDIFCLFVILVVLMFIIVVTFLNRCIAKVFTVKMIKSKTN